jgi:AAA domain
MTDLPPLRDADRDASADQVHVSTATNGSARSPDRRTGKTAAEILDSVEPELTYLPFLGRDGFIGEGWSHLLASSPRVGKTELMAHAAIPWMRLGHGVLWLSEESERLWRERLRGLRAIFGKSAPWDQLQIEYTMGRNPKELLEVAAGSPARIVIADTLRHVAGVVDENDAGESRQKVSPWIGQCEARGQTFIAAAHHRKSPGGAGGERVAGSHVVVALFDVVLELNEAPEKNRRKLTGRGRLREVPSVITELDADGRMVIIGDGRSVARAENDRRVLAAVRAASEPLTTTGVHGVLGPGAPSIDTVLRALTRLAVDGRIRRDPDITESTERGTPHWSAIDLFSGGS